MKFGIYNYILQILYFRVKYYLRLIILPVVLIFSRETQTYRPYVNLDIQLENLKY